METRRQFSWEFKFEGVKLVTERGVDVSQAARHLDVGEKALRRWKRELAQYPQKPFPSNGVMKPEQAVNERLSKEGDKLKMKRDTLKRPRPTSTGYR